MINNSLGSSALKIVETSSNVVNAYIRYYNFTYFDLHMNPVKIDKILIGLLNNSVTIENYESVHEYINSTYSDIIYNNSFQTIFELLSKPESIQSTVGTDIFIHRKYYRYSGIISMGKQYEYHNHNFDNSVFLINFYNNLFKDLIEITKILESNNYISNTNINKLKIYFSTFIVNDDEYGLYSESDGVRNMLKYCIDKCM